MTTSAGPLIATCAGGLETALAEEITGRGWKVISTNPGAVRFSGPDSAMAESNIVLRTASRILVPLIAGPVSTFDELYRLVRRVDWLTLAPPSHSIDVTAISTDRQMNDNRFAALRVKDAIVDVQRRRTGKRSDVERRSADVGIVAFIAGGTAEISLDSTGRPLHMRGYRTEAGVAPLRETVAAGMVLLSGWDARTPLLDPFCGSGTILIEAALIAGGIFPGIERVDFAFLRWPGADSDGFHKLREALRSPGGRAGGKTGAGNGTEHARIRGSDIDASVVAVARRNAERAGVAHLVDLETGDFFTDQTEPRGAMILTNPPYGERMDLPDAAQFYRMLGDHLKQHYTGSTAWILSANRTAMKGIGLRTSSKIPLFNGGLDSRLYRIALF